MEICREYRVGYHTFKSWPGNSQALAIAYEQFLKTKCPRCGTRREDFLHIDEEGNATPLEEPLFYAVHHRCPGCGEFHQIDKVLKDEQRQQGIFTTFIPAEDLDDEETDEILDEAPNLREMKLPGLE